MDKHNTPQSTPNNWFAINRDFINSDLWVSEPFTKSQAWIDLIGLARFKDGFGYKRGVEIPLQRGQLCWSSVKLGNRWKWSRGKTKRFLNDLETKQQIVQQETNVTTVITIVNYNIYQPGDTPNSTASSTPNSTADGQQKDTKEEGNTFNTVNNGNKKYLFPEPKPAPAPNEDAYMIFDTTGNPKQWALTKSKLSEYEEVYDTIDVPKQCKIARQWLIDNPTRRKTARGMTKFMNGWFSRAVSRGDTKQNKPQIDWREAK